jgi:putative transposase
VIPDPVPAPGNGQAVGIDRGVVVSAALSTGELLSCPALTARERIRLRRLQRTLARVKRGSNRRGQIKRAIARLRARETDRRKDWAEKVSTGLARRFDVIRGGACTVGAQHAAVSVRPGHRQRPPSPRRRPAVSGAAVLSTS